jgi:hypothetical protein
MSYWEGASSADSNEIPEHIKTDRSVPAGFYVCELLDFGAWPSKVDGSWNVKFAMRIVEGAQRDKFLVRWSSMTPDRRGANFDLFTNTLGELPAFDPDHGFAEYDSIRRRIVGGMVKVKAESWKKGDKSGLNVYINQRISGGSEPQDSAPIEDTHPADDKIPF